MAVDDRVIDHGSVPFVCRLFCYLQQLRRRKTGLSTLDILYPPDRFDLNGCSGTERLYSSLRNGLRPDAVAQRRVDRSLIVDCLGEHIEFTNIGFSEPLAPARIEAGI